VWLVDCEREEGVGNAREGKLRPPHAANRIAGETEAKPLSNHAIRDGQEHAREDIMTDILGAIRHLGAAAALIRGVLRGGQRWGRAGLSIGVPAVRTSRFNVA
jgi:hypothetical protein